MDTRTIKAAAVWSQGSHSEVLSGKFATLILQSCRFLPSRSSSPGSLVFSGVFLKAGGGPLSRGSISWADPLLLPSSPGSFSGLNPGSGRTHFGPHQSAATAERRLSVPPEGQGQGAGSLLRLRSALAFSQSRADVRASAGDPAGDESWISG